jgi:hypothetical protein
MATRSDVAGIAWEAINGDTKEGLIEVLIMQNIG